MPKEKLTMTISIPSLPKPTLPPKSKYLAIATLAIVLTGIVVATGPLAPISVPVTVSINDEYGGVFKSPSACEPRSSEYQWTSGAVTIKPQFSASPSLTGTVSQPIVSRSSSVTCAWNFFASINPPEVGPIERLVGQGAFPADLGIWDIYVGSEKVGSFAPTKERNVPAVITKSVLVTKSLSGVARLGDLNAKCTGDSGNFPVDYACTGRLAWDGIGWIGYYSYDKYRNIQKFRVKATKSFTTSKCWGVNSYTDFKLGASVTVTGDHGTFTTKLVNVDQVALPREIPMGLYKWYLASKKSKITVCQFRWGINDIPFSPTGYTIKVGKRDPVRVTLEEIEKNGGIVFTDFGNSIPDFTKD